MLDKRWDILLVSGKNPLWEDLRDELVRVGRSVKEASDAKTAMKHLEREHFHVVLLDNELSGLNGNNILKTVKSTHPSMEVVVFDEQGTMRSAFDSMRTGAYDYLTSPFDLDRIISVVDRALEDARRSTSRSSINRELSRRSISYDIVGQTPPMESVFDLVSKFAPTDSTVLIQGETGTGKELIANIIHQHSRRAAKSFVVVNCGAIPDNLLESELFGHEKGAFTDAARSKLGLLEVADGGTLFLDEVGELSPSIQSKVLHVVEKGSFRRLGSNEEIHVDLRIVCATNKNLQGEVTAHRFRKDLFYRLNVLTIDMPPLRERADDIPLLVASFLDTFDTQGNGKKTISPKAMSLMKSYEWPGNVRELRNVVEQLIVLSEGSTVEAEDLPPVFGKHKAAKELPTLRSDGKYLTLREMEKIHIEEVLQHCRGHRSKTAEILGISRPALYNKLKRFGTNGKKKR